MERSGREICEQAGGSDQAWQQKKRWSEVVGCVASSMVGPTSFASGLDVIEGKGDQSWVFIARTDVEAETPILGHLM